MIEKLNLHYSFTNPASVHDEEALTALELAGRQGAKINEVVNAQNNLHTNTTETLKRFENEVIPTTVDNEVTEHINDGTFDTRIDRYLGGLESRLDNFIGSVEEGSTTMDAEIIDARVGYDNTQYTNLGVAIREQVKKNVRRYRNLAIGTFSNPLFNIDENAMTINAVNGASLVTPTQYVWMNSGSLDISEKVIPYNEMYVYMWNTATSSFEFDLHKPELITEGKIIIAFIMIDKVGKVTNIICPAKFRFNVNGEKFALDDIDAEIDDAKIAYDGTVYNTLAYAIREQSAKAIRRIKNNVVGASYFSGNINIDTANKTVTLAPCCLFGTQSYTFVTEPKECGYADIFVTNGETYRLLYANEGALKMCLHKPEHNNESDYVIAYINMSGTGEVVKVIACDDIKERFYVDEKPFFPSGITKHETNTTTCKIFKKVCCVGDSFTAGGFYDENNVIHGSAEEFAWPHYMETLTGNEWVNCGVSGATSLTWVNSADGLAKAQAAGKVQAYMVGLMINDASGANKISVGSIADIGTNNGSYYAGLSRVVNELFAISPDAKVFVMTCPNASFDEYNEAVRDIVNYYKNTRPIHCLDLRAKHEMYSTDILENDLYMGHYSAVGHVQMSEILALILSDYINSNISAFKNVALIEYD